MPASILDAAGALVADALDALVGRASSHLLGGQADLAEARVGILVPPGRGFVASLVGTWTAGGVAVPLALSHPTAELDYVLRDAGVTTIVADPALVDRVAVTAAAMDARVVAPSEFDADVAVGPTPVVAPDRRALMLYTSGTTGRAKGVVTTHANLDAQVRSLIEAWRWTGRDRTLLVLPLHHVHGLINVVCSALRAGATCEMPPRFDPLQTWDRLASGEITVFTAVPTIYHHLIQHWEAEPDRQAGRSAGAGRARLMMSGSAALPRATLDRWRAITGHTLLERYGMTEIGMALANPLDGERRPGCVGQPLPGVSVRVVDDRGEPAGEGQAGEVEVKGPTVFREYWQRAEATADAFRDGWFRTGDTAVVERGAYRLLGRTNVDILKTGGFKVSALEVEDALREHPAIQDCAVVGIGDVEWGQRVCAAVELRSGAELPAEAFKAWLADRLAPYKHPRTVRTVDALPRNAMGKVIKPEVAGWFP
ncbi:MAG TPA: acyl-CoA synthetase [Vicinamibacterales bacterium]|nr:acyl-CoA synthetase [Vicinamibacterales bacterium]